MYQKNILTELKKAEAHYSEAMQITSRIGMDLFLGRNSMFNGLCWYFDSNVKDFDLSNLIISQLIEDCETYTVAPGLDSFDTPVLCFSVNSIKETALAPRLAMIKKSVAILENHIGTENTVRDVRDIEVQYLEVAEA